MLIKVISILGLYKNDITLITIYHISNQENDCKTFVCLGTSLILGANIEYCYDLDFT